MLGAARDRHSFFAGTCLFARQERSKCACGVSMSHWHGVRSKCACRERESQACLRRENAAVLSHEDVSLRPPRENAAVFCRNSPFTRTCLFAHREIQVCLRRESAAVLSHEHVALARSEIQVCPPRERSDCTCSVRTQQSCRMKISHCARSENQVCPQRENAAVFIA